jgi:hypothetical protein
VGMPGPVSRPRDTSLVRRVLTSVVVTAAAVVVSGCGASFNASTNIPYQPAAGISDRSGDIYAIDTLVVTDGEGNGTVVSRLINQQTDDDELESVTAVDSTGKEVTVAPLDSPVDIAAAPSPDQSVQLGTDGAVRLTGDAVDAGTFVTLTFTFGSAAPIEVEVPVVAVGTIYADIPVGPVADGTPDA